MNNRTCLYLACGAPVFAVDEDVADIEPPCLIDIDIFSLLVSTRFCLPGLASPDPGCLDRLDETCLRLCVLAYLVQAMMCVDAQTLVPFGESQDKCYCFRQLNSANLKFYF